MLLRSIVLSLSAVMLSACVTDGGPTDVSGRSLKLEQLGGFQPAESRFNTFMFLEPSRKYITNSTQRNNGQGWSETIIWDGSRSFIEIEYITSAWFSRSTEDRMLDVDNFDIIANRYSIATDAYIQLDQVSPRTKGWIASTPECKVGQFAKRFKKATPYDNDRGYSDAVVRFGTCSDKFLVSAETLAQKIGLMNDSEKEMIIAAFSSVEPLKLPKKPEPPKELTRLTGSWQGVTEKLEGRSSLKGAAQYEFSFELATTGVSCSGTTITDKSSKTNGTWSLSCDDGMSADGIWTNRETQDFIASGADAEKRAILFKLLP